MKIGGESYGGRQNMARSAIDERKAIRSQIENVAGIEPVVVHAHDMARNRVDLAYKDRPQALVMRDVPILYGVTAIFRRFLSVTVDGPALADVGLLIPVRSVGARTFDTSQIEAPPQKPLAQVWAFLPGIITTDYGAPPLYDEAAGPGDLDAFGPEDTLIAVPNAYMLFKSDGTLIIKAKAVYVIGEGQTTVDAKAAAREGDPIDENVGTDTIDSGSAKIFLG